MRPRLRDVHVVLARLAAARLARDGTLQRPPGAGLASRPDRARAAAGLSTLWAEEAAAWGRSGRSAVLRGRGSGSGPCLWPAGSWNVGAPAWAGQRPVGPGRREAARVSAWLPGRRAGKEKGTCHPWDSRIREACGQDSGTSGNVHAVDGLISERGSRVRTPVVLPAEVSSSGSRRADPFWRRARFSHPGWDRPARRARVTLPAGRFPARLLGKSWSPALPFCWDTLLTFLGRLLLPLGWAFNVSMPLYPWFKTMMGGNERIVSTSFTCLLYTIGARC